jgi:hypothetical protein
MKIVVHRVTRFPKVGALFCKNVTCVWAPRRELFVGRPAVRAAASTRAALGRWVRLVAAGRFPFLKPFPI